MENIVSVNAEDLQPAVVRLGLSTYLKNQVGLIAISKISKGEIIGGKPFDEIQEFLCPWDEYKKLDEGFRSWIDDFCLGAPEGFYIVGNPNYWPPVWHMNHSCDGNAGFDSEGLFIATKDIFPGEEVCYDYGLGESNPDFKMNCYCGSKNCRGIVTGNDWKFLKNDPDKSKYMLNM